jgi:cell division GTPase FtsZ
VRNHLSEGIWIADLRHAEMAEELAMLWVAVSSIAEFMLGCSPNETISVEIVVELIAEFRRQEE